MALLLYLNGQLLDLEPNQVIAQSKQVNDLNSLDNRQANYTNKFKIPKTANNIRVMQFLTMAGNTSTIPYQKNECSLYSETGECFIYKGWAVVTDGGEDYEVVVYDGIIDLYKEIENKNLAELDLAELTHDKSLATVLNSWNGSTKYKYILADYNGKSFYKNFAESERILNIDYLVPSVSVKYLWDKIFQKYNFTYSGSVFDTFNFKNLWITYPKGAITSESAVIKFESTNYGFTTSGGFVRTYYARYNTFDTFNIQSTYNQTHLRVAEAGYYRVKVSGTLNSTGNSNVNGLFNYVNQSFGRRSRILIGKNANGLMAENAFIAKQIADPVNPGEEFERSAVIELQANDSICIIIGKAYNEGSSMGYYLHGDSTLSVTLEKLNIANMDFATAFTDFPIRDFLTEIVHRFGLTMFKDKYSAHYEFLTLNEFLQGGQAEDWSDKFVKKISENYIYGSYAQRNWLRYSYNNKNNNFNDASLDIENQNLAENKNLIQSKIYSPENEKVFFLNQPSSNLYKLWEKEIVENPAEGEDNVKYKSLDKRYYFLRSENKNIPAGYKIGSKILDEDVALTGNAPFENFYKLPFYDISQEYYSPIVNILNRSLIINADIYLSETDIVNFDFRKLYYIKQLGNYFIVNKINNYVPGKTVKCELIRVAYAPVIATEPALTIGQVTHTGLAVTLYFDISNLVINYLAVEYSTDGVNWQANTGSTASPRIINLPSAGTYYLRLYHQGTETYSNIITYTL